MTEPEQDARQESDSSHSQPADTTSRADASSRPGDTANRADASSHPGDTAAKLERQVKFFKAVALIAVLGCVSAIGWTVYQRRAGSPVQIVIDGKAVATAKSMSDALALLKAGEREKIGGAPYPDDAIKPMQKIQFRRVERDAAIDTDTTATHAIANAINLHVRAYAILVNGHSTVGLPTEAEAYQTLTIVKHHFESLPPNAPIAQASKFVDRVVVKRMGLPASQLRANAVDAAPYLWTPPKSRTYAVKPGDTGVVIARKNHISLADFLAANSDKDMNRLHPGDLVNVEPSTLTIHVQVVKQVQITERILANMPESEAGKERVTYAVTYVNGTETSRRVLGMETIEKTRTRYSL